MDSTASTKDNVAEKTRTLATRLMGWTEAGPKHSEPRHWADANGEWVCFSEDKWVYKAWNPYESIADSWQVLEKVREDEDLFENFTERLLDADIWLLPSDDMKGQGPLPYVLYHLSPPLIAEAARLAVESVSLRTGRTQQPGNRPA